MRPPDRPCASAGHHRVEDRVRGAVRQEREQRGPVARCVWHSACVPRDARAACAGRLTHSSGVHCCLPSLGAAAFYSKLIDKNYQDGEVTGMLLAFPTCMVNLLEVRHGCSKRPQGACGGRGLDAGPAHGTCAPIIFTAWRRCALMSAGQDERAHSHSQRRRGGGSQPAQGPGDTGEAPACACGCVNAALRVTRVVRTHWVPLRGARRACHADHQQHRGHPVPVLQRLPRGVRQLGRRQRSGGRRRRQHVRNACLWERGVAAARTQNTHSRNVRDHL